MAYLSQWMHLPNLDLVGEVHVAQLLSVSDNTVKTRLRRARQLLKEKLSSDEWEVLSNE